MHKDFMEHYGDYLKKNYLNLDKMTKQDLCEVKEIAKTMEAIFKADKEYNIVNSMEEKNDFTDVEMGMDEFMTRFKNMYESSTPTEKQIMKTRINSITV